MASRRAKTVDVSVIIVNFNVRDYLANALRSLQKALRGLRAEIIVVDNASSDDSVEMLRKSFPRVRRVVSRTNEGFARANNLGMRASRGSHILILNPDTIVREDTIRAMLDYFKRHPGVGLAGCKILNPDGSFQLAGRRSFPSPWVAFTRMSGLSRLFPSSRLFGRYNLTYKPVDASYPVDAVSGAFMFLRRDAMEKVGGFDEAFFMYGEDLDWCFRFQKAGWEVHYVHETSIIHFKGESTRRSSVDEIGLFYKAMQIFVAKHIPGSGLTLFLLKAGIRTAQAGAFLASLVRRLWPALIDTAIVSVSILVSGYLRRGEFFVYPPYGYLVVYAVAPILVLMIMTTLGVYSRRAFSASRTLSAVSISFVILAALTAFFKDYAFSRVILLTSGLISAALMVAWRVWHRARRPRQTPGRSTIFGRRAAILGSGAKVDAVAHRLAGRRTEGFDLLGSIAPKESSDTRTAHHLRILGTTDSLLAVIREFSLTDIIVMPQAVSNRMLMQLLSLSKGTPVSFHIVGSTMDVFVGKASVESLEEVPLLEISYSIQRRSSRFIKRSFDICASLAGLITVYPFVYFFRRSRFRSSTAVRSLPKVLSGSMSFVGPPEGLAKAFGHQMYVGKPGIAGLVQLREGEVLGDEETERLVLLYARSQSLLLDIEILLKYFVEHRRHSRPTPQ